MKRLLRAASLLLALVAGGCVSRPAENRGPVTAHALHGVVQSVDPQSHSATIKHGKIEGFMDAMTMEYAVKDAAEYAKLRPGETIDAKIFVQDTDFWLGEIREAKRP